MGHEVSLVVDLDLPARSATRWRNAALPALDVVTVKRVPDACLDGDSLDLPESTVGEVLDGLAGLAEKGQELVEHFTKRSRFALRAAISRDAFDSMLGHVARALAAAAAMGATGAGLGVEVEGDGLAIEIEVAGGRVSLAHLPPGARQRWKALEARWPEEVFRDLARRHEAWSAKKRGRSSGLEWLDATGAVVMRAPGREGRGLRDQRAAARDPKSGRWGFLDATGQWAIPPRWDEAWEHRDGRALVRKGDRWGFCDGDGREVIAATLVYASHFSCGRAIFSKDHERYPFIDVNGREIGGQWEAVQPLTEDRAAYLAKEKWGYVDPEGAVVIEARFLAANAFAGGTAVVRAAKGFGIVDRAGGEVLAPSRRLLQDQGEGILVVEGGKSGAMDRRGAWIAPPELDELGAVRGGVAVGTREGATWLYRAGAAFAGPFRFAAPMRRGRAIVCGNDGAWSIIGEDGQPRAELALEGVTSAGAFEDNGLAWVEQRGRYGLVDEEGRVIVPLEYEAIEDWDRPVILARRPS
jgi:hypothetical protein